MVNKVILVGNAGKDAELRSLPDGRKVTSVNIATSNRVYDSATQSHKDYTEWHSLTLWNALAETAEKFIKKGTQVYVEGRLSTQEWTDDKGSTHRTTTVVVQDFKLLGKKPSTSAPEDDEDWS